MNRDGEASNGSIQHRVDKRTRRHTTASTGGAILDRTALARGAEHSMRC
jgi:hypothetical protein